MSRHRYRTPRPRSAGTSPGAGAAHLHRERCRERERFRERGRDIRRWIRNGTLCGCRIYKEIGRLTHSDVTALRALGWGRRQQQQRHTSPPSAAEARRELDQRRLEMAWHILIGGCLNHYDQRRLEIER